MKYITSEVKHAQSCLEMILKIQKTIKNVWNDTDDMIKLQVWLQTWLEHNCI